MDITGEGTSGTRSGRVDGSRCGSGMRQRECGKDDAAGGWVARGRWWASVCQTPWRRTGAPVPVSPTDVLVDRVVALHA